MGICSLLITKILSVVQMPDTKRCDFRKKLDRHTPTFTETFSWGTVVVLVSKIAGWES